MIAELCVKHDFLNKHESYLSWSFSQCLQYMEFPQASLCHAIIVTIVNEGYFITMTDLGLLQRHQTFPLWKPHLETTPVCSYESYNIRGKH